MQKNKSEAKASITSERNLQNASKKEENQTINSQKNTQESMKDYLRERHEWFTANAFDMLGSVGLEEEEEHFYFLENFAFETVIKLIDEQQIILKEESVLECYQTINRVLVQALGALAGIGALAGQNEEQCVCFSISVEGKTMGGVLYTEEGMLIAEMGLAA